MQFLTVFKANGNRLIELPDQIARLTQLRELNVECNRLRGVSAALANLGLLEELKLASNELTDLPDSIVEKIRGLKEITLQDNHLRRSIEALGTDAPDDSVRRRHVIQLVPPAEE